ncbi:hypothetical protein [Allosphingosinicella deserti]|uniref:Uncharacterized protein n=1 Tax=Allosphingosinicella deserti TaxID=2116704 RepID=A0A2P7QVE2_9SPHN|nr:hypothetical protein [Sphingomonas deserti]PSJ41913.1 hypothetical protein C7I55_06515 [Sphingomonas deserti]
MAALLATACFAGRPAHDALGGASLFVILLLLPLIPQHMVFSASAAFAKSPKCKSAHRLSLMTICDQDLTA